jgi:hypothetical protein
LAVLLCQPSQPVWACAAEVIMPPLFWHPCSAAVVYIELSTGFQKRFRGRPMLGDAEEDAVTDRTGTAPAATPALRVAFIDPAHDSMPRTLISFFGVAPEEIEAPLDGVVAAASMHAEFPIFVTTTFCFEFFRSRSLIMEYLPSMCGVESEPERARHQRYLKARYAHLIVKWAVQSEIQMGVSLDAFIASCASGSRRCQTLSIRSAR